jgi:L-histidine Nalpha-methyltransferase
MRHSVAPKTAQADHKQFADDVRHYLSLSPRQLPSRYLYDELGSALFMAICHLPWYRITRTETRLLSGHADHIFTHGAPPSTLVELGPGDGEKLSIVVAANSCRIRTVHLVDLSRVALEAATCALSRSPELHIVTHQAPYEAGLADAMIDKRASGRTLVLFLGSNIGNFDPTDAAAMLQKIRGELTAGDVLLLGADLVKPERDLLLAYDDPLGVTAAFNRNLLVRMNRELGADFDAHGFTHRAVWNPEMSRVEMHLVSIRRQHVRVPASDLAMTFEAGETIWTESSYKYGADEVRNMLDRAGFNVIEQWTKDAFALTFAAAR